MWKQKFYYCVRLLISDSNVTARLLPVFQFNLLQHMNTLEPLLSTGFSVIFTVFIKNYFLVVDVSGTGLFQSV
jgi:hypothetical protein